MLASKLNQSVTRIIWQTGNLQVETNNTWYMRGSEILNNMFVCPKVTWNGKLREFTVFSIDLRISGVFTTNECSNKPEICWKITCLSTRWSLWEFWRISLAIFANWTDARPKVHVTRQTRYFCNLGSNYLNKKRWLSL